MNAAQPVVYTFLIADIRGYSRYTDEYGAEAAARLTTSSSCSSARTSSCTAARWSRSAATSPRRLHLGAPGDPHAVDLQKQFDEETELDDALPMRVGIGIDSGEAAPLEDGTFRGSALNVAARLCGRAHGGEVLVSEATSRLAGRMAGLTFRDRGRVRLKNIPEPVHILSVRSDEVAPTTGRWVFQSFGRPGQTLGWKLVAALWASRRSPRPGSST